MSYRAYNSRYFINTLLHFNQLRSNLDKTINMHFEQHAHYITQDLITALKELPKEGNPDKIAATNRIIKAYEIPIPTRPNSPSSESNMDNEELIPVPNPIHSGWRKLATEFTKNEANKENIPLTPKPCTMDTINEVETKFKILNIHDENMVEEVAQLKEYLHIIPTYPIPTKFTKPSGYTFWIQQENEAVNKSYWALVLSTFLMKNKKGGSYQANALEYAQAGPDNSRHFIGYNNNTNKWIITDTKKKLFAAII
jgi:hypothetical protein